MVVASSSSSSSCDSFSSVDEDSVKICCTVKFLCSYGGRILPRYPEGRLRYVAGETRVLTVDRSLPFSGLQVKLRNLCGWEKVNLRCQLPTEDLDALVSVTSDEDLANLIEEYDLANQDRRYPLKIRAFLHDSAAKSPKSGSPFETPLSRMMPGCKTSYRHPVIHTAIDRCIHRGTTPAMYSGRIVRSGDGHFFPGHPAYRVPVAPRHCLVHHRNHWQ